MILKTAVDMRKVLQDFDSESFAQWVDIPKW